MKIPFYREGKDTLSSRTRKKLTARENRYKRKPESQGPEEDMSPRKYRKTGMHKIKPMKPVKENQEENDKEEENLKIKPVKGVMFVPYIKGSVLARALKENKERLFPITKNKVKIVERTGVKLVDIPTKSDPWQGHDCERRNCLLCITKQQTEKNESQPCTMRSLVYETDA